MAIRQFWVRGDNGYDDFSIRMRFAACKDLSTHGSEKLSVNYYLVFKQLVAQNLHFKSFSLVSRFLFAHSCGGF